MKRSNIKIWASVFVVAMVFATTATVIADPPQQSGGVVPVPPGNIVPIIPPGQQQGDGGQAQGQPSDESGPPPGPYPYLTLSPTFADLGMYSIHESQWITYSFNVTNTGTATLTWSIDDFPWWVAYITINGQQGYGGSCAPGQTKVFTIHVCTGWLEDPYANDNLYTGTINLTSNANDATATVVIDMMDPEYPGHELWDFLFPSNLEPGDLLFMDAKPWIIDHVGVPHTPGDNNDHVALYYGTFFGTHWFIESNNYSFNNLTLKSGVKFTPWWVFCFWAENFEIGKVNGATMQQKNDARSFENKRRELQDKYQSAYPQFLPYSPLVNPNITNPSNPYYQAYLWPQDPYINYWYCSELAWASYLHATPPINIDHFPEHHVQWQGHSGYSVGPGDILQSTNITTINLQYS